MCVEKIGGRIFGVLRLLLLTTLTINQQRACFVHPQTSCLRGCPGPCPLVPWRDTAAANRRYEEQTSVHRHCAIIGTTSLQLEIHQPLNQMDAAAIGLLLAARPLAAWTAVETASCWKSDIFDIQSARVSESQIVQGGPASSPSVAWQIL